MTSVTEMQVELAPIVVFVYNRPDHTRRLLDSLILNKEFKNSKVFVFCDGLKNEFEHEEKDRFNKLRSLIRKFAEENSNVSYQTNKQNLGLSASVIKGVSQVLDEHNRCIILEDDLVLSSSFLNYMNAKLNRYERDYKVAGISGFSYLPGKSEHHSFWLPIGCSWGWGTWKRSWKILNQDSSVLLDLIKPSIAKFNYGDYDFYGMLKACDSGVIDSWAILFYASFFLKGQGFLFPKWSLVENAGFGEEATHTRESNSQFGKVEIADNCSEDEGYGLEGKEFESMFRKTYTDRSLKRRFLNLIGRR